jgi:hypothetical protein
VAHETIWVVIFLMVILKIPIVYLCLVVWWAIRAEPRPEEGAAVTAVVGGDDPPSRRASRFRPHPRRRTGPRGGPARSYARSAHAHASARTKRL